MPMLASSAHVFRRSAACRRSRRCLRPRAQPSWAPARRRSRRGGRPRRGAWRGRRQSRLRQRPVQSVGGGGPQPELQGVRRHQASRRSPRSSRARDVDQVHGQLAVSAVDVRRALRQPRGSTRRSLRACGRSPSCRRAGRIRSHTLCHAACRGVGGAVDADGVRRSARSMRLPHDEHVPAARRGDRDAVGPRALPLPRGRAVGRHRAHLRRRSAKHRRRRRPPQARRSNRRRVRVRAQRQADARDRRRLWARHARPRAGRARRRAPARFSPSGGARWVAAQYVLGRSSGSARCSRAAASTAGGGHACRRTSTASSTRTCASSTSSSAAASSRLRASPVPPTMSRHTRDLARSGCSRWCLRSRARWRPAAVAMSAFATARLRRHRGGGVQVEHALRLICDDANLRHRDIANVEEAFSAPPDTK